jgi:hypothetical protein
VFFNFTQREDRGQTPRKREGCGEMSKGYPCSKMLTLCSFGQFADETRRSTISYHVTIKPMKKIVFALIFLGIVVASLYIFMSNKDVGQLKSTSQSNEADTEVTSEDFTWSTTDLEQGPKNGGSDFISASSLEVSAFGKTYRINDYLNEKIYGCKSGPKYDRVSQDLGLAQYDSSYSPTFLLNAVSYYLCPAMAGGDLFVIEETSGGYGMKHYPFGDGRTPFTKLNPAILFTIQK